MKVVILAGGYGTRLGNITESIPKPMVKIGEHPILWHIMKIYSSYGFNDFVISLGYKSEVIKDYFYNFRAFRSDFTVDLASGEVELLGESGGEDWRVSCVFTGLNSLKGARIKRIEHLLDDVNMVTYGDGVADIDLDSLVEFHRSHDRMVTITGVFPPARFGELLEDDGKLLSFEEKPQTSSGLINGGFMVFDRKLCDYLSADESCDLEYGAFEVLTKEDQIRVYKHVGKWECVDHERDLKHLNDLWHSGNAFWKSW